MPLSEENNPMFPNPSPIGRNPWKDENLKEFQTRYESFRELFFNHSVQFPKPQSTAAEITPNMFEFVRSHAEFMLRMQRFWPNRPLELSDMGIDDARNIVGKLLSRLREQPYSIEYYALQMILQHDQSLETLRDMVANNFQPYSYLTKIAHDLGKAWESTNQL